MQTQTHTHTYKSYGVVTILAREGALSHIEVAGGDQFWVRSALLKEKRAKRQTDTAVTNLVQPPARPAPVKPYLSTPEPSPEVDWVMAHLVRLEARVPERDRARFAENLFHANGQAFDLVMEGVKPKKGWSISLKAYLNADVPAEFRSTIEAQQVRLGNCKDTPLTEMRFVVHCNEIGWALLRRGAKLG